MKKNLIFIFFLILTTGGFSQKVYVEHRLNVVLNPTISEIDVVDTVITNNNTEKIFSLNAGLKPYFFSKNIKATLIASQVAASDVGMDHDSGTYANDLKINKWQVHFKGKSKTFVIRYKGTISSSLTQSNANYQRGFSESSGIVSPKGVYLAGSTYWIPEFKNKLITFKLTTTLPEDWKTVSQGKRTYEVVAGNKHIDTWQCNKPQEEVFLIAARFTEYSYNMNSGIEAMAFLRTPDEGLANKYLEVTEQYMEMYQHLITKYPYSKFALVENFWETGYGMPSFTLLGEKIIRFPFILYSSYPHELLHNWWGNSVYVNFSKGNWCEGITAYMADHLIKEQRGQGENYRRSTLQKYTDFVNPQNDFPLSRFVSRYNASSEAIGYGKALMMWHMLRRKLGDEDFKKGMRLFYEQNKFKKATYADIRKALEEVSGMNLKSFFNQWINRTGAPELKIKNVYTDRYNSKYRIFLTLEQTQNQAVFTLDIPVAVATENGLKDIVLKMDKKTQIFQLTLNSKPLKMGIDPQYDVFRRLNPQEVPPVLSKVLASHNNIIVLPSSADSLSAAMYKELAEKWSASDSQDNYAIVYDKDISKLPNDKTAWIIGYENKFAQLLSKGMKVYRSGFTADSVRLENKILAKAGNSFVINIFAPKNFNKNIVFITPGNKAAIDGLVRKLPHYGKYSYLAFEGAEPTNIAKGQWPVIHSPLVKVFVKSAEKANLIEKRNALAYLKPLLSEKRMMAHIKFLASDELKGRGLGTPTLDKAAEYIAQKFKKYGLKTLGNSYFQNFSHKFNDKGTLQMKNVIAIVEGTDPKLKDSPVVVSAHYDHLGLGWPDVHKGDKGKIHHGADDNASGVAIMLELAKNMAKSYPKRTIVFVAFTGEEEGLIGSRYFVNHAKKYFEGPIMADINLDTDGSLFDKKLLVLNANTAREWKFIFMGTDYTTGVKSEIVPKEIDASDQVSFNEKGIPAVQLFTGATQNYHRPTDTYDKIDGKGLVKVATVAKEVVEYLANRGEPLQYTGKTYSQRQNNNIKPKKNRRVSTGSIPDFAYTGIGVKIGTVIKGSTGDKAGLKKNDVIIALNGTKVNDLREYSDELKKYLPGNNVKLTVLRNGKKQVIALKLGVR